MCGKGHQAKTAQHARECRVRELQPFGIHDMRWCPLTSPLSFGIGRRHHFFRQVDAYDGIRAHSFCHTKQHSPAAAGDIEHALAGFDADRLHKTPTERRETGRTDCLMVPSEAVEHRSYFLLPSIGAVTHAPAPALPLRIRAKMTVRSRRTEGNPRPAPAIECLDGRAHHPRVTRRWLRRPRPRRPVHRDRRSPLTHRSRDGRGSGHG